MNFGLSRWVGIRIGVIILAFNFFASPKLWADDATATPSPGGDQTNSIDIVPAPTPDQRKSIFATSHASLKIATSPGKNSVMQIDLGMRRLMASSSAGTTLISMSLDPGTVRYLPVRSVNDIAIDTDDDKVFTSTDDQTLMVLDRKSLVRIDKIILPGHCGAVVYVPSCHKVLVAHTSQNGVWSIDAHLHTMGTTAVLHGDIVQMVYDSASDKVLGLCSGSNDIAVIDPWSMTVIGYWAVTPSTKLTDIGVDSGLGSIFAADTNGTITVMEAQSGAVLSSVDTGSPISSITYDPSAQQIYCLSQFQGVVNIVQLARGGSSMNLGQIATITGVQSAAIMRGSAVADLWVSYSDERGSYIQCYSIKF